MVYITGDCHAEFRKFYSKRFPEQKQLTRDDYVIVCGDFGLWHDDKRERNELAILAHRPFTILFVDGNHENFDRLYSDEFEIVDFHGGKAHKIRENVYHLMRGQIFELCGKKFFAFGGASSHDTQDGILDRDDFNSDDEFVRTMRIWNVMGKRFRVNHVSWWKEEMPSDEEIQFGMDNLLMHNNEVDFIISHCCSSYTQSLISKAYTSVDKLTAAFNAIEDNVKFKKWYFGHYHRDVAIDDKHILMYRDIVRIV